LALAIDNSADITEQVGQVLFGTLATTGHEGIETPKAACQLMRAFPHGHPAPTEFAFSAPLSSGTEFFDGTGHKKPSRMPLEGLCCLNQ
jgi:hypothetical protein